MSPSTVTKLGDVCQLQNGYPFDSIHFSKTSGMPLIRIRDLKTNVPSEKFTGAFDHSYVVNKGDLLVGMDGEFIAREWNGPAALLNQRVCRLTPDPEKLDRTYLMYALGEPLRKIENETAFTTVKHLSSRDVLKIEFPLPPLAEQKRVAAILTDQIVVAQRTVDEARAQKQALSDLVVALLRDSMACGTQRLPLAECLTETKKGVGPSWRSYPVLGATRAGLALAKEPVGKQPERYKLVDEGTIFYNPMRILLGSIATVDSGDSLGITSPDYVVFRCNPDRLHHRWFYHWLRSPFGERFIKGLTRGAVRERLLFKRLAVAAIEVPSIEAQEKVAVRLPVIRDALEKLDQQIELAGKLPSAYLRRAFAGQP